MDILPKILLVVSVISIVVGVIFKGTNLGFGPVNAANFLQLTYICLGFAIALYLMQIKEKIKS